MQEGTFELHLEGCQSQTVKRGGNGNRQRTQQGQRPGDGKFMKPRVPSGQSGRGKSLRTEAGEVSQVGVCGWPERGTERARAGAFLSGGDKSASSETPEPIAGFPSQPLGSTCFVNVSCSDSAFSCDQRSFLKLAAFMTSPVVKSPPSHFRGCEFDRWLEN